jgi:hypothetical protein
LVAGLGDTSILDSLQAGLAGSGSLLLAKLGVGDDVESAADVLSARLAGTRDAAKAMMGDLEDASKVSSRKTTALRVAYSAQHLMR